MKAKNIHTKRPDLEHIKPVQPCDAYFGGCVNASKLYHKCEGLEAIHYMDVSQACSLTSCLIQSISIPYKTP